MQFVEADHCSIAWNTTRAVRRSLLGPKPVKQTICISIMSSHARDTCLKKHNHKALKPS